MKIKQIFRLYDVLPRGTPARSLRLRSAVLSLLLAVVDAAEVPTQSRAEVRLKQLVDDMCEHPEREYLIDRIAERLGLSPSNLLLRFKRLTGLPPHAFLLERRINKAKELLAYSLTELVHGKEEAEKATRRAKEEAERFSSLGMAHGDYPQIYQDDPLQGGDGNVANQMA